MFHSGFQIGKSICIALKCSLFLRLSESVSQEQVIASVSVKQSEYQIGEGSKSELETNIPVQANLWPICLYVL